MDLLLQRLIIRAADATGTQATGAPLPIPTIRHNKEALS